VGSNGNVIVAPDSGRAAKSQSYNGLAQIVALWADGDNLRNDVEFSFDTPLSPPGTTYSALDSDARDNFKASYHQRIYDLARLT